MDAPKSPWRYPNYESSPFMGGGGAAASSRPLPIPTSSNQQQLLSASGSRFRSTSPVRQTPSIASSAATKSPKSVSFRGDPKPDMKLRVLGQRRATDSDNSSDEGSNVMSNVESVPSGRRDSSSDLNLGNSNLSSNWILSPGMTSSASRITTTCSNDRRAARVEPRRGSAAESVSDAGSKHQHAQVRKMSSNSTRIEMDFEDEDADQVGELAGYRPGEHRKESDKSVASSVLGLALMDSWQSHGGGGGALGGAAAGGSVKNRKKASIASTGSTSSRAPRFVLQPDEDEDPVPLATACSPTHIVFSRPGDSRRSSRALEEIEVKPIPQVDVHAAEDDDDW
ncbi:unnamed protein product [Notodromas monacha]|uniref:Uncharacterized protein n=1 Tax=Notodromas monacha TaxID=399045 RepID=A0A7R9GGJ5_9CRUS|nr:unnamed protein product [Notodromas monacha]CAG0919991.1 unnamed protein product [Notodromas monacha]